MTSNVGSTELGNFGKGLGFSSGDSKVTDELRKKEIIKKALKSKFRPEFLNRLDDIIVFNSLEKEDIEKIVLLELKKLIDTHSNCIIIVERCHICNGKVFSQMLYEDGFITNDDYGLYKIMYNKYLECFCFDIDKVIYLKVEPSICWERYNIRNRTGELIDIEYLEKIETYYDAMINGLDDSVGIYKINGNEELQDIFHRLKRCLILENLHFNDKEKEFIHTTIENKV